MVAACERLNGAPVESKQAADADAREVAGLSLHVDPGPARLQVGGDVTVWRDWGWWRGWGWIGSRGGWQEREGDSFRTRRSSMIALLAEGARLGP